MLSGRRPAAVFGFLTQDPPIIFMDAPQSQAELSGQTEKTPSVLLITRIIYIRIFRRSSNSEQHVVRR